MDNFPKSLYMPALTDHYEERKSEHIRIRKFQLDNLLFSLDQLMYV